MKTDYSYSTIRPQTVQSLGMAEKPLYQVNFDTEEVQALSNDGDSSSGQSLSTQYRSLYLQVSVLDYNTLVAAIITSRYSSSDVEAIMLNNLEASDAESELTDEKRAEYISEYNALQEWRKHAKEIAKTIMP